MKVKAKSNGTLYYDKSDREKLFEYFYKKYKDYTLSHIKQTNIN